jgi:hypothetical protein
MAEEEAEAPSPAPSPAPTSTKKVETVSYLADDFDVISAQATAKDNLFHKSLSECFHVLRDCRDDMKPLFSQDPAEEPKPDLKAIMNQLSTAVSVNFIDPTTNYNQGPKADNMLSLLRNQS